jgi:hypothetical protein
VLEAHPSEPTSGVKGVELPADPSPKVDAHPYDNLGKAIFAQDEHDTIPKLYKGIEVVDARNVEIDRSKLRADLIFKVLYCGIWALLNIELQSGSDKAMGARLLQYVAGLHEAYEQMPVLSLVIYLFRCQVQMPPYVIECGDKRPVVLDYEVMLLWETEGTWFMGYCIPL